MVSLETRAMFAEQMTAGQVYRNELAYALRALGHEIDYDPRSGLFEVRNVPAQMIRDYSRRAEQIAAHAKEHGFTGQEERQRSFYATRPAKAKVRLEDLHKQWADRSQPYRDAVETLRASAEREATGTVDVSKSNAGRAALFGIRQAESREAVNSLGRILRLGLASHVGEVLHAPWR